MITTNGPILAVEKLRKEFGRITALEGIDLALDRPGVYGFLGPNGAGKTTTFKIIAGLLQPTSGRVLINGTDVQENTRLAVTELGVQFDAPAFYPYLTGRENLEVIARWLGRDCNKRIDELLAMVGLTKAAGRRVAGYSWGMKQRLGLASTLLSDPKLVILDEPTNGLDPGGIADMRRLLPRMAGEQGRTVLLSSHRMEEVEQVCDFVTIIHNGSIAASGTMAELASGQTSIEIACPEPDRAIGVLQNMRGIDKLERLGSSRLRVSVTGIASSEINRMLIEDGIAVDQVVERRESLEEVFFRLTGIGADE